MCCFHVYLVRPCLVFVCPEKVTTCDGNEASVHRLSCDVTVISVESTLYGRSDSETCSTGRPAEQLSNTECSLQGTLEILKSRCNGKRVCELNANVFQSSDPCPGTHKYLETTFTCLPACESCVHEINDDDIYVGQVITIHGGDYGRHDQTTCSYKRPASQLENILTLPVASCPILHSCNGQKSCTIYASNSVFGDPCVGTYKYLELAYTCECKCLKGRVCELNANVFQSSAAYPGQIIVVHSADYGRHDRTTCSYKRPASQLQNVYCSRPTKKVAESCNGRNSCTIYASNSVFGDPCHGTYKYLELIYTCQCKCLKRGCFTFILLRLTVGFHHMCKKKTPGAGK
uniref:SUEL-type lectin domain-containing protein n=1 Tax=Myripristis murdjan TaxID=586833 RepID=A0A667YX53_9TELE